MKLEQALKYYLDCGVKMECQKKRYNGPFNGIRFSEDKPFTLIGCKDTIHSNDLWLVLDEVQGFYYSDDFKPILYPLDLTKPIWYDGKEIVPMREILKSKSIKWDIKNTKEKIEYVTRFKNDIKLDRLPFCYYEQLFKWRIDVFNLIGQGSAIDVNTLETNPYK